jgi:hypothetical protein
MRLNDRIRLEVFERDEGLCQWIDPVTEMKCLKPASDCHHRVPKGMGGRPNLKETTKDLECRCNLHNHAVYVASEQKYYMGHTG